MCDIDAGLDVGFDIGSDFDISEGADFDASSDIDSEPSFEGLDDIDGVGDFSDTSESFELNFESNDLDIDVGMAGINDYPSLDEFDVNEMFADSLLSEEIMDEMPEAAEEISETEYEGQQFSLSQMEDVEPEMMISTEYLEELVTENADNPDFADRINELIESGRLAVEETVEETIEGSDAEEDIKVLTREITPEALESRERDTEEVLENYRENLQNRGIPEERIEEFVNQERDKNNAEYESLDCGDLSSNIYQEPTDWDAVANSLAESGEDIGEISDIMEESSSELSDVMEETETVEAVTEEIDAEDIVEALNIDVPEEAIAEDKNNEFDVDNMDLNQEPESIEEIIDNEGIGESESTEQANDTPNEVIDENISEEMQELPINYEEIYEEIDQAALEQGFKDIDIYADTERLDSSLEHFEEVNWEKLSLDNQKESISDLAEYVEETIGFENPPKIEYYNNPREGDYGGYNENTNTLHINEYMLYNSNEAADTIAHELWHAHQHECAEKPQSARDYQYQYNFENYIRPEMGHEAYENQLIEAEARAFAEQFKGRLAEINRRNR